MAELRWNPILRTWTIMASHRQNRPLLEDGQCPFCPGSGRIPDEFDILAYDNDFPSLMLDAPLPDIEGDDLAPVRPAFGKCEVTLYSPKHDITLPELPIEHVERLVEHWEQRYRAIGSIAGIDFVFIFENRGEAVGVTMIHPHGQIYAYPYVPLRIKAELDSCDEHFNRKGSCLFCDIMDRELKDGSRVVYKADGFTAFVPSFAEYPYQVHIYSESHTGSLSSMTGAERRGLAAAIKCVTGGYDDLFGFPFPYMMCLHQDPTDTRSYPGYHFHIEFYPPMRSADKIKYNASSETGAWATINPTVPEEKAAELRSTIGARREALEAEKKTGTDGGANIEAGGD